MKLDHQKNKEIVTKEEQSKKITLTNLAALTGYTYQQLYYNGYKNIASSHKIRKFNRVKDLPTVVVSQLAIHDSTPKQEIVPKLLDIQQSKPKIVDTYLISNDTTQDSQTVLGKVEMHKKIEELLASNDYELTIFKMVAKAKSKRAVDMQEV